MSERRELRRQWIDRLLVSEGECDDCGESDVRVLAWYDRNLKAVSRKANDAVAWRVLATAVVNGYLLCPTDLAKRLADKLEEVTEATTTARREANEAAAEILAQVEQEHGIEPLRVPN